MKAARGGVITHAQEAGLQLRRPIFFPKPGQRPRRLCPCARHGHGPSVL